MNPLRLLTSSELSRASHREDIQEQGLGGARCFLRLYFSILLVSQNKFPFLFACLLGGSDRLIFSKGCRAKIQAREGVIERYLGVQQIKLQDATFYKLHLVGERGV